MSEDPSQESSKTRTAIIVAIITGVFGCLVAAIGLGQPVVTRLVDIYFPPVPLTTNDPPNTNISPPSTNALNSDILFRDDFDKTLADGWSWVSEDSSHWNLPTRLI